MIKTTQDVQLIGILAVFVASVIGNIFVSIPHIAKIYKEYKNGKGDKLNKATLKHDKLTNLLNQFLDIDIDGSKFERVVLWNVHNGENIFKKVHLWKMQYHTDISNVHSAVNISNEYTEKINLTFYYDIVKSYNNSNCSDLSNIKDMYYINDVDEMKDSGAKYMHKTLGDNTLVSILLRDSKGAEIGILNISTIHHQVNINHDTLKSMKELAVRVSSLL